MDKTIRTITAAGALAAMLAAPAFAQTMAWSRNLWAPSGAMTSLGDGRFVSRAMASNAAGDVFVTGTAAANGTLSGTTARIAGDTGAVVWQQATGGTGDTAVAVALDAGGNAIVAGTTRTSPTNADVLVVKYAAADGSVLWRKTYDAGGGDYGYAIAIDSTGNVIVGAESLNAAGNNDIKVLKLDGATGSLDWQSTIDGGRDDFISDLALDGQDNVLAAGASVNAAGDTDVRVSKLNGIDGTQAWTRVINGSMADEAYSIAADANGNALVAGYVTVSGVPWAALFKLASADGTTAWQKAIGPGTGQSVAADGAGNVYLAMQSVNAHGDHDFRTQKYTVTGTLAWDAVYDTTYEDYAYQLAIDASGDPIVAGSVSSGGNFDWHAIHYAAADGSVVWHSRYNGTGNGADESSALALGRNGSVYLGGLSNEQGRAPGVRVAKLVPGSPVAPNGRRQPSDFDGDKRADVIWQATDGSVRIWLMNGTQVVDTALELGPGTGWNVAGTGDFDGDGKADIVWQNANTGAVAIWMMNGLNATSFRQIYDGGGGWRVTHVGDLDGDGKADLVWRSSQGAIAVWLMDGTNATAYRQLLDPGTAWTVAAVGDLDGDGRADLVLQYGDGTVYAWLMNGTAIADQGKLADGGSGWSVVNAGDLDGDGKADLVWTHTSGAAAVWLMNGKTMRGGSQIAGAGTGWTPRKALDFDGDGKADLLWDHTDGSVAIWLMNGAQMLSGQTLVTSGNPWSVSATGK